MRQSGCVGNAKGSSTDVMARQLLRLPIVKVKYANGEGGDMNVYRQGRRAFRYAIATVLLLTTPAVWASDSERHQHIGGMDIYLGVVPAQMTAHHPDRHAPRLGKRHVYHVLVALFDGNSGERITDAEVQATVTDHALTALKKRLVPMHMDDALSYGHFFRMELPGRYDIAIEIQRVDSNQPISAAFIYRRPKD